MPDLLDAEQVGRLLRVDRSTVYRMAETGRLPAAKIGRQWRFRVEDVARLLDVGGPVSTAHAAALTPVLDVAARLLGVMMLVTDMAGHPVTRMANPCGWFRDSGEDADVLAACAREWEQLAEGCDLAPHWRTGPLGFDCARAFLRSGSSLLGMVLAGGVATTADDPRDLHRLDDTARDRVLAALPDVASSLARLLTAENDFTTYGSTR